MFIGHFAAGMACKKLAPKTSLATLFLSAQLLDLLWPTLLLLGLEEVKIEPGISKVTPLNFIHYPYSHSLLFVVLWALLFGGLYFILTKNRSASIVVAGLVISHWLLDLLVHIPDLPLTPDESTKVGLGLWNSLALTILVEGVLFAAGIALYLRTKKKRNENISWWFWSLIIFLVVIHTMNFVGPPPPNVGAIAWDGQLQWLFVLWAWQADRKS